MTGDEIGGAQRSKNVQNPEGFRVDSGVGMIAQGEVAGRAGQEV